MADYYSGQRVKRSLFAFLFGKLGSGLLGFLAFALMARLLEREAFGALMASMAFSEILIGLSTFGIDWVAAVHLPGYRIHATHRRFWRFVVRMVAIRAVCLAAFAFVALLFAQRLAEMVGMSDWLWVFRVYLVIAWLDGMLRFLKDAVMDSLLMQGANQLSIFLKNLCTVSYLLIGMAGLMQIDLLRVVQFEVGTNLVAMAVVTVALLMARRRDQRDADPDPGNWVAPTRSQLIAVAKHNYATALFQIISAPNIFVLGIERFLGLSATAAFGFARTLAEQVRKYLPSELFVGMIRTMIIATYARTGDARELALHHSVVLKLGLFPVALLSGVMIAFGAEIIQWVGSAKYAGAHLLVLSFVGLLGIVVLKRNVELFLNATRNTALMLRSSLAAVVSVPIGFGALYAGGNLHHVVGALAFGELLVIGIAVLGLRRRQVQYRLSISGIAKLFLPAIVLGLAFRLLSTASNVYLVLIESVLLCVAIALTQWLLHPLTQSEISTMRTIVNSLRNRSSGAAEPEVAADSAPVSADEDVGGGRLAKASVAHGPQAELTARRRRRHARRRARERERVLAVAPAARSGDES